MVRSVLLAFAMCMLGVLTARAAPEACFQGHEETQALRRDYRYREAREAALRCAQEACPKLIRSDCSHWYAELERTLPSVVFAVHDGTGHDLVRVRVHADDALLTDKIDGRALELDPGAYTLRFEAEGYQVETRDVTIRESEKARVIEVELRALPAETNATPSAVETTAPVQSHRRERAMTPAVWALGGVALAGAAGLIGFGVSGDSKRTSLEASCGTRCAPEDVDQVRLRYTLANVSIAVGGAALLTATILYFVGREVPSERGHMPRVGGSIARHGGVLTLESSF